MTEKCLHEWQPAEDIHCGRYRCVKCGKLGWRSRDGEINAYKQKPSSGISDALSWDDCDSFYEIGMNGKCPTMSEQEMQLFLYETRGSSDDD